MKNDIVGIIAFVILGSGFGYLVWQGFHLEVSDYVYRHLTDDGITKTEIFQKCYKDRMITWSEYDRIRREVAKKELEASFK